MFLACQNVWPVVITVLLGMKMVYWDCFLGVPGGEENSKNVGLRVIAEEMEMCSYFHVGKINSQDASYRLDDFKCLYST
jgi:hypothetical protein